jgi:hypothetical protein
MATATKPRSAGSSQAAPSVAVARAAARTAKGPVLAAGATALGLAGGIALRSRVHSSRRGVRGLLSPRPKILGVPLGRKSGLERTVETLGELAQELGSATRQAASATDEVRQVREQLEQANRQSPVEVLLNALTHRRGAHRQES